jgi:hypothetical protein
MTIDIELKGDEFKIKIDDIPHLVIKDRIIGYQSYNYENKWYKIEYYLKDKTILAEYDSKEKWINILKQLDNII